MDYRAYDEDYGYLFVNFKNIAQVLTDKLNALKEAGFRGERAYFFGFSFGARLITKAGIDFGEQQLARADRKYRVVVCCYRFICLFGSCLYSCISY